jgi:uncharacterized protein YndB with AHSA1/START domain
MPKYDVVSEGVVEADPQRVFQAFLDECMGKSRWWMPHMELSLRGGEKRIDKGSVIDHVVHGRGSPKFAGRVVDVIENSSMLVEYFEGDFLGTGEWTFEAMNGKTRVRYRWKVRSNRLIISILAPFIGVVQSQLKVMEAGFEGMNNYLKENL